MIELEGMEYPDVKLPCNRENMTKLVEALESGEYQQARGWLKVDDTFCCLGVACNISGLGQWNDDSPELHPAYITESDYSRAALPKEVMDWLGVDDEGLLVSGLTEIGDTLQASSLNDGGWNFQRIAARIREVYLTD